MPVMPFEGLQSESVEDVTGTDAHREPTHTVEDERYYTEWIMPGLHDEQMWHEPEFFRFPY